MRNQNGDLVWVIEDTRFDECHSPQDVAAEVKRQGMTAHVIKYAPMGGWDDQDFPAYPMQQPLIFIGSLQLGRLVHRKAEHSPGIYCNPERYACTSYYPTFGKWLLNDTYAMIPYAEAARCQSWLFKVFSAGEGDPCVFVRPNSGMKTLATGSLVQNSTFQRDLARLARYKKPEHLSSELLVFSSPKMIAAEYRFIMADREVVACSRYKPTVDPEVPDAAVLKAIEIAHEVKEIPERMWVLDIAQIDHEIPGRTLSSYSVVEINSFSCAGWYACDLPSIVREASRVALQQNAESVYFYPE